MRRKDLRVGEAYMEPWENSHTDGTLIYVGGKVEVPNDETWYGFEEPTWGYRWLTEDEIDELIKKENK